MQRRTDPLNVLYVVYETNADLECVRLMYTGFVKDIAETLTVKFYKQSGFEKDFMILNKDTNEMVSYLFSDRTIRLRNECRG